MAQRYVYGQKVKIIGAVDQHMKPKYPEIEAYVTKTGTIIDGYWVYNKMPKILRDEYVYTVLIDDEKKEIAVAEDALMPYIT